MGMRTQLEYFYQEFKFEFKSLDPDFPKLSESKICYSSLRTVDSLKNRVLQILKDRMPKLSFSKLRFFCRNQTTQKLYSLEFVGAMPSQAVLSPDMTIVCCVADAQGQFAHGAEEADSPPVYS